MDRRIVEVAARLAAVREALGVRVYRTAVERALQAIAVAAHAEAERRPRRRARPLRRTGNIVRFPLARARRHHGGGNGGQE